MYYEKTKNGIRGSHDEIEKGLMELKDMSRFHMVIRDREVDKKVDGKEKLATK